MAFDMGFDFRATAGAVTDPAYGVPVLSETYPHTYTNGNGDSINAGWQTAPDGASDTSTSSPDPRIAGSNYSEDNNVGKTFTVDLSSGSAPGAGTYIVDLAMGRSDNPRHQQTLSVKDNTTVVIDLTNGGPGYETAAGHFIDASGADVAATTSWTGTTVSKTFSSTTVNILVGASNNSGWFTDLAHFRLTLQGGGADVRQEHIAFGIGRGILMGR